MRKKQFEMNLNKGRWGGRRGGSGRPRLHSKGVAHRKREKVVLRTPLHINFKFKTHIRNKLCLKILKKALLNARRHGLQVVHFSMQSNHIHIVAEAKNNEVLTRGMRSLTVSFAKGINKGRIQVERYHLHVLKTLREARNAIHYVLFNEQKHTKSPKIDGYGSLLNLKEAYVLIKNYAAKEKVTLVIEKTEDFGLPAGSTYLLTKGLDQLIC